MILPLDLESDYGGWSGPCKLFALPSGYSLTYDLGGGSRTRSNHPGVLTLMTLVPLLFCLALDSIPVAQAQPEKHSGRKVIHTQTPDYPAVLKSKGIGGVVRLNVRVLGDGTVAHVGILGGNPILAECAIQAVMQWKYAHAASATNEVVVLDFGSHH